MTVGRRQVVGWGALGLGAFALDCGGPLPWAKAATMQPEDVERLLRELDRVVLQLKSLEPDTKRFGIKPDGPYVAAGNATCMRLLTTICFMGTYRDVPETMWHEPNVERRLAETLPKIRATIRTARDHLAGMTDDEGARIDKRLQEDPDLTMRIMERVDDYAKQVHVPIEQRTYLRAATAQLAGRFRYEGTKEVTSKLTAKYDRALATRMSALGMQGEPDADSGEQAASQPTPLRTQFRTRASPSEVHVATCSTAPRVVLDGVDRQILLDWEESRCPATGPVALSDEHPPIHGAVHTEPGPAGENTVTVVLYPPPGSTDTETLPAALTSIAEHIQSLVAPKAPPTSPPPAVSRLGSAGESCRTRADCEPPLDCSQSTCRSEEDKPGSEKLIATTGQVAKWGAILLIPPICAIGVLVLLVCLFMVIVAGCMYAGGD